VRARGSFCLWQRGLRLEIEMLVYYARFIRFHSAFDEATRDSTVSFLLIRAARRIRQRLHTNIAMTSGYEGQALVDLPLDVRGLDHPSRFHLHRPALLAVTSQDHGPPSHYHHFAQQESVWTIGQWRVAVYQHSA
jgi:hypothetical protein